MFRKPKKKIASRQTVGTDETKDSSSEVSIKKEPKTEPYDEEEENVDFRKQTTQSGLLSFDHDEGADADFALKKDKALVKELKRMKRLEEEAENQRIQDEKMRRIKIEEEEENQQRERKRKKREKDERERRENERKEREKYLDRYRDENSKKSIRPHSDESDVEVVPEDSDVREKFPGTFDAIPDSRRIYELKKMRERMKNGGYIPLDDDKKIKESGTRERLVREDENDGSDDEEDRGNFYSSKSLMRTEEERRREEQDQFLAHEQGDEERDPEMDEWEKQQILKAVSRHTIGQIREEVNQSAALFGQKPPGDASPSFLASNYNREDMDMDIEVDPESFSKGPSSTGGVILLEDIMAKLKLRINDREEALASRKSEIEKMKNHFEENQNTIAKLEADAPMLGSKFTMYQDLRCYVRNLLDCLNEKVAEINAIADKRRLLAKAKTERLLRRRRRDVQDQYGLCSAAATGKNTNAFKTGENAVRAAERESRRAQRRRDREATLTGISHEEGLSSDDGEAPSLEISEQQTKSELSSSLNTVFVDALDEFAQVKRVLDRLMDWLAVDGRAFQDAYVEMCIPKLCSPYVRIELIQADILNNSDFVLQSMPWFIDTVMAGSENLELEPEHEIVVGLVPKIIEKVVLPFLTDLVNDEWDPLSLKQTTRLGAVLGGLTIYPSLTEKSKTLRNLLEAVKMKITASIDEDLFTPMFSKQAIENPNTGCRSFVDRQFWSAIKLLRCINKLSDFISAETHFELSVENVINKVCVMGIQFGITNDATCERKVRALMEEIRPSFYSIGGPNSFRSLKSCFNKVTDDMRAANRDFYRELRRFAEQLPQS